MKRFGFVLTFLSLCILCGCGGINASLESTTTSTPVLKSIQISPGSPSVAAGLGQQLTASGKYSDGSSQDLTSSVTWSSSNGSIATVSNAGLATGKTMGSATITAKLSGVSGSVSLAVTAAIITGISVSPSAAQIAQSTTQQFVATGTFTDGSTKNVTGQVQWTVSNTSVASIDLNGDQGLTLGLAAGASTVMAASGSVSSTAKLTVTNATLVSIDVTPVNASIPLATVQQFSATGTFSDGTTQNISDTVTWSSSDSNLASITVGGIVTGKNLGSATITATSASIDNSVSVSVNASDLLSLAIKPSNPSIAETTSVQFSAVGTLSNGSTRDFTGQVTWSSDNTPVSTVVSGRAKGLAQGSAHITATLGTVTDSTLLTVTDATLTSISVTPANSTMDLGTQMGFTATGSFNDGSTQVIDEDVTWGSSNMSVASLGGNGTAVSLAAGTTMISASLDGVTGSTGLTVSSATLQSISVSPSTAVLAPTATLQYNALGTFSDGTKQSLNGQVTWSSSDGNVVTVSSEGMATGESAGAANITAKQGSVVSPNAAVVVDSSPLTSLAVTPSVATVAEQTGIQLHAIATFGDGSTEDLTTSAQWGSTPSSVATVTSSSPAAGFATGVAPGTATITAIFASESGSATLTVTNATLTSIAVTPSNRTVSVGTTQQFTAVGTFSDGTTETLTTLATWTSSNVAVATINKGLATTEAAGTTTITASVNGVSGTTTLTVQ